MTITIDLDHKSHVPLYLQIVYQVRTLIARGALSVGDRLPAHREFAAQLGVNRSTIMTAYEELAAEGLIRSRIGSGTFINGVPAPRHGNSEKEPVPPSPMPWSALLTDQSHDDWLNGMLQAYQRPGTIALAHALPDTDLFPLDDFRRCVDSALRKEGRTLLQLGSSEGYAPLQRSLASQMTLSGMSVQPKKVLITNGCQQALELIHQLFVRPGEAVAIENPTYPGALSVFCGKQATYLSVPVGDTGLDLNVLEDLLLRRSPKLLYTIPNFHNPTGVSMDLAARRRLIEPAVKYRVPIIEDDIYGELRYGGPALPSLKALDQYGLVLYLNSFSKVAFPGVRVGWIAAPRIVIEHLTVLKRKSDLHTNLLAQAALYEFTKRGVLTKHLKRVRKAYAERRDTMFAALERYFPKEATWSKPTGGMGIWVQLPHLLSVRQILVQTAEQGVTFSPGEYFYASLPQPHMMRLSFTTAGPEAIAEAVKRLGAVIKAQLVNVKKQRRPHRAEGHQALV